MNYSIFLGPNCRYVPDEKWDQYRSAGELRSYDLVFRRGPKDNWYIPVLVGPLEFRLGQVFMSARRNRSWGVIPNPALIDKKIVDGIQVAVKRLSQQGFATRLDAAEYLMRVQEFTDPLEW